MATSAGVVDDDVTGRLQARPSGAAPVEFLLNAKFLEDGDLNLVERILRALPSDDYVANLA